MSELFCDYKVIRNFIDHKSLIDMHERMNEYYHPQHIKRDYTWTNDSPAFYGIFDDYMLKLKPLIEKHTGLRLLPTYSYARIYTKDSFLTPHSDREPCEISFTLTIKLEDTPPWDIYMSPLRSDLLEVVALTLNEGDICVYRGCDNKHWRDHLKHGKVYQAFFHYVDADGPYTEWENDMRENLEVTEWDEVFFDNGTDKGTGGHGYGRVYEKHLKGKEISSILEFGVFRGNSLAAWREIFPDADITGVDINDTYFDDDKISSADAQILIGDSTELELVELYDVIIDDASHDHIDQYKTFMNARDNFLQFYIIEDVFKHNIDALTTSLFKMSNEYKFAVYNSKSDLFDIIVIQRI